MKIQVNATSIKKSCLRNYSKSFQMLLEKITEEIIVYFTWWIVPVFDVDCPLENFVIDIGRPGYKNIFIY
jgi:hypothetical protein